MYGVDSRHLLRCEFRTQDTGPSAARMQQVQSRACAKPLDLRGAIGVSKPQALLAPIRMPQSALHRLAGSKLCEIDQTDEIGFLEAIVVPGVLP